LKNRATILIPNEKKAGLFLDGLSSWAAFGIYVLFMIAVYWPVFLGQRFFWEDFFIQEYPIREFCFYVVRVQHTLPFWNPYSWAWSPLMADAQSGFWYPTNLLQIAITWLTIPQSVHLPVLVPETMTLLHLPLAALGVFVLLKREFRVAGVAALLAGLCWGFGVRMAAEQNHSMQILQLALLPWETLLLMSAWKSWRYAIGLGLLFGISFFAGQPQTFFFIAIFLGTFTVAESLKRWRTKSSFRESSAPLLYLALGMIVAVGITAIQLLPSMELVALSARNHLDFLEANTGAIHLGHFIDFFVPKFYGEYPGFNIPFSPIVNDHYWYWEATYYWSAVAEIIALFAVINLWRNRRNKDPKSRHIFFIVVFSIFALGYGMGHYFIFYWPIWRFIPLFDHFRAPNRMIWFLWFLGTIMAGIGLDILFRDPEEIRLSKRYFYWASGIFVGINLITMFGVIDLFFKPYTVRAGIWIIVLPSLIASVLSGIFFFAITKKWLPQRFVVLCAIILIAGDLYYNDFTWHRNTVNRETVVAQDSSSAPLQRFRSIHSTDHSKLLVLYPDSIRKMKANLGMFLREPIEYAENLDNLLNVNPLRLDRSIPLVTDSIKRMDIMGVATKLTCDTLETELQQHLPFLKLYHHWRFSSGNNDSIILNDTSFDFTKEILLSGYPALTAEIKPLEDTIVLAEYSENHLKINVATSQGSVLLVNDLYYPAWRAAVDGKDTKILRAFTSLRAIPITAGTHVVELRYESATFDLGWKITLGTLAFSIIALFIPKKQKNPDV
jgi:hypothetical protein